MPVSSLDLILNVSATGVQQVRQVTAAVSDLISTAKQALMEQKGFVEPYPKMISQQSQRVALQEMMLESSFAERLILIGINEEYKKNEEALKRMNELDRISWQIMKDKQVSYADALVMAREELEVMEMLDDVIASTNMNKNFQRGAMSGYAPFPSDTHGTLLNKSQSQLSQGNFMLEDSFNRLSIAMSNARTEGQNTSAMFQGMLDSQAGVLTQTYQLNNMLPEQRLALGGMAVELESISDELYTGKGGMERWNEVNRLGAEYQRDFNLASEDAIMFGEQKVRTDYEQEKSARALTEAKKGLTSVTNSERMALMQASIGMFVLGITTTQTLTALSQMVGTQTTLGQMFKEMATSVKLMLGPLQVYMAIQQLMISTNKQMLLSMLPYVGVLGTAYFIVKAFTAQSKELRAVYTSLAIALGSLTVAYKLMGQQAFIAGLKAMYQWITASGPAAPAMAALLIGTAVAAIAAGLAINFSQGQTLPGYMRPVTQNGLFYAHKGEMVGRVGSMSTNNNSSVQVNITIESGASVDDGVIRRLSQEIRRSVASGNGV